MTLWLVDDGPFGRLARHLPDDLSWPAATIHIMDIVERAASTDKSGRRQALLQLPESAVQVHSIGLASDANRLLYDHLRPNETSATRDLGEDASIAYLATEMPQGVFVAEDKGAVYQALAELGPSRVATPFDLFYDLWSQELVDRETYDGLCQSLVNAQKPGLAGIPRRFAEQPSR